MLEETDTIIRLQDLVNLRTSPHVDLIPSGLVRMAISAAIDSRLNSNGRDGLDPFSRSPQGSFSEKRECCNFISF
jgi:hypothetical protein